MFKIATWNVNSLRTRLSHVLDFLDAQAPDVLALQETKVSDAQFPLEALQQAQYQSLYCGQKSYNGVALLSRERMTPVATSLPDYADPQRRVLAATLGELCILNVYVPMGSEIGSEKYHYKLDWLQHLHRFVDQLRTEHRGLILLGDLNIAPEDRDVHDPAAWQGKVLVSEPERQAFRQLITLGMHDCLRLFENQDNVFTWWDYRQAAFRRNLGLRLDHILASAYAAEHCRHCYTVRDFRTRERPSDHCPVVAEFDLPVRS